MAKRTLWNWLRTRLILPQVCRKQPTRQYLHLHINQQTRRIRMIIRLVQLLLLWTQTNRAKTVRTTAMKLGPLLGLDAYIFLPEMTSIATSGCRQMDWMSISLKGDYSITTQLICKISTVFKSAFHAHYLSTAFYQRYWLFGLGNELESELLLYGASTAKVISARIQ